MFASLHAMIRLLAEISATINCSNPAVIGRKEVANEDLTMACCLITNTADEAACANFLESLVLQRFPSSGLIQHSPSSGLGRRP